MTPPCPAPAGCTWEALPHESAAVAFVLAAEEVDLLVAVPEGAVWDLYHADGAIIRDGVTAARLPAAILALVSPAPKE